jgi:hypothetical protein
MTKTNLFCPVCGKQTVVRSKDMDTYTKVGNGITKESTNCDGEFYGRLHTCTNCNESFVKESD